MVTQGPLSPATTVDDSSTGTIAWTNPNNSQVSDNVYTTATIGAETTHYLKATNFGFSVPTNATINGIVVEAEANVNDPGWILDYIRIVKSGLIGSTNKTLQRYSTTDSYKSAGSSSDLWGETWTSTDINDSVFGVAISTVQNGASRTISVDHIRITVYYMVPSLTGISTLTGVQSLTL